MSFKFIKMHSSGNDFVIINNLQNNNFDLKKTDIQHIANRKRGIGFDQLLIIGNFINDAFPIKIYNSNGSEAKTCINGTLCVSKYLMQKNASDKILIKSGEKIFDCINYKENLAGVRLENPSSDLQNFPINQEKYNLNSKFFSYEKFHVLLNIGNSHLVIFLNNKKDLKLFPQLIEDIKESKIFTEEINISISYVEKNTIYSRVLERGVGETLSCGSAACCIYYAAKEKNLMNDNKFLYVEFPGGRATIDVKGNILINEANHIFNGEFIQ